MEGPGGVGPSFPQPGPSNLGSGDGKLEMSGSRMGAENYIIE